MGVLRWLHNSSMGRKTLFPLFDTHADFQYIKFRGLRENIELIGKTFLMILFKINDYIGNVLYIFEIGNTQEKLFELM